MADQLNYLHAVTESRQDALERAEANLRLLAVLALRAFVEGEDVREIGHACGFDLDRRDAPSQPADPFGAGSLYFSIFGQPLEEAPKGHREKFIEWMTAELRRRLVEAIEADDR